MSLKRPTGVTFLSVLYGLNGLIFILFSLVLGTIFSFIEPPFEFSELLFEFSGLTTIIASFLFILGLLFLVAARGLWTGKGWARKFSLALAIIGILVGLGLSPFAGGSTFFGIIIDIILIYYLTRQNVKDFFSPRQPTPQMPPSPPAGDTFRGSPIAGGVQTRVICAQCGTENASGALFCKTCGVRLLT